MTLAISHMPILSIDMKTDTVTDTDTVSDTVADTNKNTETAGSQLL